MFKSLGFVSKRQRRLKEENPNPQITFEENRFVLNQAAMEALGNPQYITFAVNEGVAINETNSIHTLFIVNADNADCWKANLPRNGSFRNKKLFEALKQRGFNPQGTYHLTVVDNPEFNVLAVSLLNQVNQDTQDVQDTNEVSEEEFFTTEELQQL